MINYVIIKFLQMILSRISLLYYFLIIQESINFVQAYNLQIYN